MQIYALFSCAFFLAPLAADRPSSIKKMASLVEQAEDMITKIETAFNEVEGVKKGFVNSPVGDNEKGDGEIEFNEWEALVDDHPVGNRTWAKFFGTDAFATKVLDRLNGDDNAVEKQEMETGWALMMAQDQSGEGKSDGKISKEEFANAFDDTAVCEEHIFARIAGDDGIIQVVDLYKLVAKDEGLIDATLDLDVFQSLFDCEETNDETVMFTKLAGDDMVLTMDDFTTGPFKLTDVQKGHYNLDKWLEIFKAQ